MFARSNALVDLDIGRDSSAIVRETDKAFAIMVPVEPSRWGSANDALRTVWIPKSQITWTSSNPRVYADSMHVPAWLASAKSL